VTRLRRHGVLAIVAGVVGQPRKVLEGVRLKGARHELRITRTLERALELARVRDRRGDSR